MEQPTVGRLRFGELEPVFQPSLVPLWELIALRSVSCSSTVSQGFTACSMLLSLCYQLVSASLWAWGVLAGGWTTERRQTSDFFSFLSASGIYPTMVVAQHTSGSPSSPCHRSAWFQHPCMAQDPGLQTHCLYSPVLRWQQHPAFAHLCVPSSSLG